MRQVHAGVAEADARERRREHHPLAGVEVVGLLDDPPEPAAQEPERLGRPDVADRVGAVVGRPADGAAGARTLVERPSGVRLERMAQDVHAARDGHAPGQARGQQRIDDREARAAGPGG